MAVRILVFYGSYRSDRMGIRLVDYVVAGLRARGGDVEFVDAKAIGLPMLDRMYKEYPPGSAPEALESLASKIRASDAFVFVTGEYNWGMQPGLKNSVGPIALALTAEGKPIGEAGLSLDRAFPRFADDLFWWSEAAKMQRARRAPPY